MPVNLKEVFVLISVFLFFLMKSPADILAIADSRLNEANILFANKMYDGAFYLAGYSVELTLKAKICERLGLPNIYAEDFTDNIKGISEFRKMLKTHNLHLLLIISGLKSVFDANKANDKNLTNANSLLFNCWDEDVRYKPCGHKDGKDVEKLLILLSGDNGLLSWIQRN